MGQVLLKLLVELLVPIFKTLIVYNFGKNTQKKEEELKDLEQQKKELEKENELLKEQYKIEKEITDAVKSNSNYVYDEWLSDKDSNNK